MKEVLERWWPWAQPSTARYRQSPDGPLSIRVSRRVELCCGIYRTKFIGYDHKTYKDNFFSWGMFYFFNQYFLLKYSWFTEMFISSVQQVIHLYICVCVCVSHSAVSNSLQPREPQPTRLLSPWNSPGKNTGVGCHFLLQHIYVYICKYILKKYSFPLWLIIGYWI